MKEKVALIPAYEPTDLMIPLIEAVSHAQFIPVVVDDGSGSEYEEIFNNLSSKAVLLVYTVNRGKGCAAKRCPSAESVWKCGYSLYLPACHWRKGI